MGRAPCCDKVGLKKGPWTPDEDQILISFIQKHGHSNWRALPKQAGLLRCGKSCRLRWINYLRPDLKRGNFTKEEEDSIIQLHEMMGNRWSAIAARLSGRTDNEIKNVWHTHLKKRLPKYQTTKLQGKNSSPKHQANNNADVTNSTSKNNSPSDNLTTSSQQSNTTSDGFSSLSEVSSMEEVNMGNNVKDEQVLDSQELGLDYLPIIDDTFWSFHDTTLDDNNMSSMFSEDYKSLVNNSLSSMYVENDLTNIQDSMDFWIDAFVQAAGDIDLPEL